MNLEGWTLLSTSELPDLRERFRAAGPKVVWTNGCFDLFHAGHAQLLRAARFLGDVLVVGINSDASVSRLKGRHRQIPHAIEPSEFIASLACVGVAVIFEEDTPEACIKQLRPAVHCKGADYAPPRGKSIPEAALVESYGGRVTGLIG